MCGPFQKNTGRATNELHERKVTFSARADEPPAALAVGVGWCASFDGRENGVGNLVGDELMKTLASMGGSTHRECNLPKSVVVRTRDGMILSATAFFKGAIYG